MPQPASYKQMYILSILRIMGILDSSSTAINF